MRAAVVVGVALAVSAAAAPAQKMPVATVLAKADALKAKGPLALFSGDLKLLKREMEQTGLALKAERNAAAKAGKKPAFCPPTKPAPISSDEILAYFRGLSPVQQRQMTSTDAMRSMLAKRYPCGQS